jgi:hypothetical protein
MYGKTKEKPVNEILKFLSSSFIKTMKNRVAENSLNFIEKCFRKGCSFIE